MSASKHRIAEAVADHIVELSQTRLGEMVASYKTLTRANEELEYITGITRFFESKNEFQEFQRILALPVEKLHSDQTREFGDFQTPPSLARRVCEYLAQNGVAPTVVVEPTFGMGNFILAALDTFPTLKLVYGIELQARYEWHLKIALLIKALLGRRVKTKIELYRDNIFTHEFSERVLDAKDLLILGNPPWVTSAALGALESANLPQKQNLKALNGMDALTGKSNFDISEYILLQLLDQFATKKGTLALIVKNATAKNIVEILPQKKYLLENLRTLEIDAAREFNVAVGANVFVAELGAARAEKICRVATLEKPQQIKREFGWIDAKFVSDAKKYKANAYLDGESIFVWRQGIKHDCARVMELDVRGETLWNGDAEQVHVESEYAYWILKSSDLQTFEATPRKKVIVTQKKLNEDTLALRVNAPRLWKYLEANRAALDQRKSSIYRDKPRFSIFGVGDYSFAPYKVAISGLYKEPNFALVCPIENRPVLVDDTCYMLPFDSYLDALITATLFNSERVKQFLQAIVFNDAKRPYTKQVLMRVDISKLIARISLDELCLYWKEIGYTPRVVVTQSELDAYKYRILNTDKQDNELQLSLSMQKKMAK